jgi:hypothetical protein
MATRSRIGIEQADGTVKSIYCHWDGYPKGVGKILVEHYLMRDKVESLMELGSISTLGEQVEPTGRVDHTFEMPELGITVAYHRDRGERLDPARIDKSLADFIQSDVEEFGYVMTRSGEWLLIDGHRTVRETKDLETILSLRLA